MNHQNYEAYMKNKEQPTVQKETTVNIKGYTQIELLSADGKAIRVIDISRYGGVARFS